MILEAADRQYYQLPAGVVDDMMQVFAVVVVGLVPGWVNVVAYRLLLNDGDDDDEQVTAVVLVDTCMMVPVAWNFPIQSLMLSVAVIGSVLLSA